MKRLLRKQTDYCEEYNKQRDYCESLLISE